MISNTASLEKDCPFCLIRDGELPASKVYEGPSAFAIMSLEQPNPYKVLVITKQHIPTIFDLDVRTAGAVFQATVRLSRAVLSASSCDGLNIVQSNMEAGQQDVFHFHIHIVPRYKGDAIRLTWDNTPSHRELLDRLAASIRREMK